MRRWVGGCIEGYVIGRFADGTMNVNGKMFASMCTLNSFMIGGSKFSKSYLNFAEWKDRKSHRHFCISLK